MAFDEDWQYWMLGQIITSAISKGDVSIAYFPEQVLSLTIGHL